MTTNGAIFVWADQSTATVVASLDDPHLVPMVRLAGDDPASVQQAAASLNALPPGKRCLHLFVANDWIFSDPADHPPALVWPVGSAKALQRAQAIAAAMPQLDVVLTDIESSNAPSVWNPAFQTQAFANAMNVAMPTNDQTIALYDDACASRVAAAIRSSIYPPFKSTFQVQFGDMRIPASDPYTEFNNHPVLRTLIAGNAQDPAIYGKPGLYPITQTPFGQCLFATNTFRHCVRQGPTLPWYAGINVDNQSIWPKDARYWTEYVRHGLLTCGLNGFLFDANDPTCAPNFKAVKDDLLSHGDLSGTLDSTAQIDVSAKSFATVRVVPPVKYNGVTLLQGHYFGRVTFASGVRSATINFAGMSITVQPDSGGVGAWVSGVLK